MYLSVVVCVYLGVVVCVCVCMYLSVVVCVYLSVALCMCVPWYGSVHVCMYCRLHVLAIKNSTVTALCSILSKMSFFYFGEWVNPVIVSARHLFTWISLLYCQRYIYCLSSDKGTVVSVRIALDTRFR